jgi:2-polyprenyl-3-methyl-5-hydroxy-6-metoxy-1,4-benzoquinol methylase
MTRQHEFDLERIVPDLLDENESLERDTLEIHLARYRFASSYVEKKRVLDLACGVGYGSAVLHDAGAERVLGVDLSPDAIAYARNNYAADNLEFEQGNGMTFTPSFESQVIVSLETIEHIPDPRGFVHRLASFLSPKGLLIGSVPTTLSTDANPYHLHDFSEKSFRTLFNEAGLDVINDMHQVHTFSPMEILKTGKSSKRNYQVRKNLFTYYLTHPWMAFRRLGTTIRHGFANKYVVLVGKKR